MLDAGLAEMMITPQASRGADPDACIGLVWSLFSHGNPQFYFGHGGEYMWGWNNVSRAWPWQQVAVTANANHWDLGDNGTSDRPANTFPVTFLFVGVGLERRGLIREGLAAGEEELAQNARRWTTLGVSPFEIATEAGRRTWRQLLLAIEKDLVLADAYPGTVADDLADYLFARSTGHFASLMTLIARGCRRAVRTGAEKLTRDLLDQVRNDAAAEAARQELLTAFDAGKLSARPAAARAKALAAG